MKEYNITIREDGSAVVAKDYQNPDNSFKAMKEKPYLFEEGMKVVDPWGNIVTITKVNKYPSVNNQAPQWTINVKENGNTYVYYELAGIFVREVSTSEIETFLKGEQSYLSTLFFIKKDNSYKENQYEQSKLTRKYAYL